MTTMAIIISVGAMSMNGNQVVSFERLDLDLAPVLPAFFSCLAFVVVTKPPAAKLVSGEWALT